MSLFAPAFTLAGRHRTVFLSVSRHAQVIVVIWGIPQR